MVVALYTPVFSISMMDLIWSLCNYFACKSGRVLASFYKLKELVSSLNAKQETILTKEEQENLWQSFRVRRYTERATVWGLRIRSTAATPAGIMKMCMHLGEGPEEKLKLL